MANAGLLGSIETKSITEFRKDLLSILRIANGLSDYHSESSNDLNDYYKKLKSLVGSFNKKYKGLQLELARKSGELTVNIFLDDKGVKDAFANSASQIIGLQSIGSNSFGAASVSERDKFTAELENSKDNLYIAYYNPSAGASNICLRYNKKAKNVQLVYDADIEQDSSADFQIAAYYALSHG